jgi:1,4-dihydroxy-2-naphthoyl-CoA hydrolase
MKEYYTIRLHDTDAAGILFFAHQFKIVHDVYEQFLTRIGFNFRDRFSKSDFFIVIVHAEADFHQPLTVGDTIEIELSVVRIGESSYTLEYRLTDLDGLVVGTASTVHVTIDPISRKKIGLPGEFRTALEQHFAKGG